MRTKREGQTKENVSNRRVTSTTWIKNYLPCEFAKLQRSDAVLGKLHRWMDSGGRPVRNTAAAFSPEVRRYWLNWELLERHQGVLYKRWISLKGGPDKLQLLIPKALRKEVLTECHNSITAAHMGVAKTTAKIKQRYYWYRMPADVKEHIRCCSVCGARKKNPRKPRAPLQDYRVGAPLDRVSLDVMGPFPRSERDNQYVLVIGDNFTRWIEAYPIPNQQAETIAKRLVHDYISRYGSPLEIHSDQGRSFESELFKETCRLLDVAKTRTSPYHPSSNGIIESFNSTLVTMIRSYVDENQRNWDEHIPLLTAAYRSTVHPATGFTPNMLMLGREVNLPIDVLYPKPANEESHVTTAEYVNELRNQMENCHALAREHLGRSAERQKRSYDTRLVERKYNPADLVFFLDTSRHKGKSPKLQTPWKGPCVVVLRLSDCVYKIRCKKGDKVLHHDRLRPYMASEIPKWARKQQNIIRCPRGKPDPRKDVVCDVMPLFAKDNSVGPVTRSRTRARETLNQLA